MKKICFDSEPNPLRVDKSGLHRKKSTFRLFLTAASYSPLQKTPKKTKNVGGYMSKKRTRMSPLAVLKYFTTHRNFDIFLTIILGEFKIFSFFEFMVKFQCSKNRTFTITLERMAYFS